MGAIKLKKGEMNEELLQLVYKKSGGDPEKYSLFKEAAQANPEILRMAYDKSGADGSKYDFFLEQLQMEPAQPTQTEQATPESASQAQDPPTQQVRDPQLSPAAEQWQPGDKPIVFGQDTQQQPEAPTPEVMEPSAQNIPEPEERLRAKTTRAQDIEEQTGEPVPGKVQESMAPLEKFRVDEDLYEADQVLSEMEESGRLADAEISPDGIRIKATGRDYQQRKREALGEQDYLAQKNKKPTLVERELPTREDDQSTLRQYRQAYEDLSTDNKELSDAFQAVNSRLKDEVGDDSLLGEYINLSFVRQIIREKGEEGELTEQQVSRSMEEIDKKIIEIAGEEGPTRELLDKGLKIFTLQKANEEEFKRLESDNEFAYARKVEELIETKQAMADSRNRQYNEATRLGKAKLTAMRMLHPALAGESNVTKSVLKAGARLAGNLGTLIRSGRSATPGLMGKFTAPENLENIIGNIDEGAAEKSEAARRAVGDFMMGLAEDIEDSYPVASNRRRSPNSLVLKLDLEEMGVETQTDSGKVQFDIDREGNILGAYDTEGYLIPDFEVTPELAQTIDANKDKAKSQWNTDGLYQTISDTVLDLGVQIMIMKGMGAGASAGKVGNALINTGVTAGMMMQSQYKAGLEAFDGDEDKAMDYAITTGLLVGAASNAFGMEARLVGGKPLFQSGVGKAAMSKGALKRVVSRTGGSPALSAARVVTLGTMGETTEETILETGINMATTFLMGGEVDMPDKEGLKSTAAVSMAVGFLGAMVNVRSGVRERQGKLYAAAVNGARADLPGFKTQLRKAIDAGKIDVPTRSAVPTDAEKAAYVEEIGDRVEYIDVSLSQMDVPEDTTPELIPLLDMKYDRVRALQGRNVSRQRVTPSTARARQLEAEIQAIDKRIDKITGVPPLPEEEAEKEVPAKTPKELEGDVKDMNVPIMEDGTDPDVATINEPEISEDANSQTGTEQESQEADQTIEETPVQGEGEQQAVELPDAQTEELLTQVVGERLTEEVSQTVETNLQEVMPGLKVRALPDAEFKEQTGSEDPAFVDYDENIIYVNSDQATSRQLYEEAAHVALTQRASKNQQVELARTIESELMAGTDAQRRMATELSEETTRYENGIEGRSDEFLSKLAGRLAEAGETLSPRRSQRIIQRVNNFFGRLLGRKPNFKNFADAADFLNNISTGVRQGGLSATDSGSGGRGRTFSKRQDNAIVLTNMYQNDPSVNPTQLAAAMADRGFSITTREAFDHKMDMIERGIINVPDSVVKRDQDAILNDDPAYAGIRNSVEKTTRTIRENANDLLKVLTAVEGQIENAKLRDLVPRLRSAVSSGDPVRIANVAREMSPVLRADSFGTGAAAEPAKDAVKAQLSAMGIDKPGIRKNLNGFAEAASKDENIQTAREMEQQVRARGMSPDETIGPGNTKQTISGTFSFMTNAELNALRADIGYDRMEATERKSIDQTLNEARDLLDTDGSGYRHEVESGLMGVTGPSAIAEKSLSGLPITEAELAAMGMTVRHIVEKRAEKTAILNELKSSPRLTMRRQSQLEDAIERDNRDIERYTRAIKRAKSSGARILSTTRWLNLTEKLYSPDWMRQKLYESVGEGNRPTQEQIDALEESIRTMQAAQARIDQLEDEETEAAKPVYEARAEQAFEEMQMAVTPDNVGKSPFWQRLLGKGRPRTLQDAVDQYAETLNDDTSTFFKRNVAFHEVVRHLSLETDSVGEVVDRLVQDYPNIAPDRETAVVRVQDALVNLSSKDIAKKRIEIKGRIKTINKAKEGITDLRAGFEKLNRPYSKQAQLKDTLNEVLPDINDAIKKVHSLISQRTNLTQEEIDKGLIRNGVNLNPDDIHQAYQKLAEVNGGIATLSRNSGENFDPQNAKRELNKIFQAINRMEEYMQIDGNKADTRVTELQARLDALSQNNPDLSAMYDGKNIDRIDPLLSEPELNQIRAARKSIGGDLASALRRVNRLLTKKVDEEEIFTSRKIQVPVRTAPTRELPPALRKSKPRYKDVELTFEDDLAKALYVVGGNGKSKHHDAFIQWLNDNYGTETNWEEVGTQMRDTMKSSVEFGATSFRLGAPKSITEKDLPTGVTRQEMREVKVWTAKSVKKGEKTNLTDTEKINRARENRIQKERNRINNIVSELSGMIDLRKSVNVSELIRLGGELRQLLRDYPEIVGSKEMADKLLEERNLLDNVFRMIERNKKITKEDTLRAAREKLRQEYEKKQEEIMNDMERVAAVELDADSFRFVKVTQRILDQEKIVAREKSRFDAMMKKFRRQAQLNQQQSALGRGWAKVKFGAKDSWEIGRSLIYMADMSYFGNQLYPFIMKYLGDFDIRRGLELAKETDGTWSDGAWAALSGTMPNMGGMLNVMKRGSWDIAKQHVSNWLKTEQDRRQLTEQLMRQITDDPFYRLFKDAGLELASPGTIEFADEMWKSDFNQYVLTDKLFGRTRDLSEDLMTVTINMARMEMMKDYYLSHPRATQEELVTYATGVNLFTGRGSTKNEDSWFNKPIGFLSYALSAPRLLISKIVLGTRMLPYHIMGYQGYAMGAELLGAYGGGLVGGLIGINATQRIDKFANRKRKSSPAVRAHIDDLASAARGFLMTYHGISAIAQVAAPLIGASDIGDDPDEAKEYLKVRVDDVILDPSGGFGSLYRTALKIFQLGAGSAYGADGKDLMTEYLITNRLHPSANVIWGAYTGQDFFGDPYAKKDADLGFMTIPQELLSHVFSLQAVLPITYQQILEGFNSVRTSDEGLIDDIGTAAFTTTASFLGVNAYQVETDLQRAEAREIPNRLGVKEWEWPKPTYPSNLDLPGIEQQRTVNNTLIKIPPGTGFTDKKVFQESVQMNELKRRYTEVYENAYAHMLSMYPAEETISKLEETIYPGDNSDVAKQARWEVILKGKEGDEIVSLREFWDNEGFPETVKNLFFGDPEVRNLINVMPLNPDFVKMTQLEEVYGK